MVYFLLKNTFYSNIQTQGTILKITNLSKELRTLPASNPFISVAVLCFYLWIVKADSQENPLSIYSKHFALLSSKCHKRTFVKQSRFTLANNFCNRGWKNPNSCKIRCHFDDKAMQKILLECSLKNMFLLTPCQMWIRSYFSLYFLGGVELRGILWCLTTF